MELASMLLNQLTGKNNTNIRNDFSNTNNGKDFGNILNKFENKENINKSKNQYSKKNKDNLSSVVEKNDDKKIENNKYYENKSLEKTEKSENIDNNVKKEDKVIAVDDETLDKLSEILNVSKEDIMQALANLSMSISMLQDSQNLSKFLQTVLDVKAVDLLNINNIKDIFSNITEIAKNVDYQDILYLNEDFENILTSFMEENKNINLLIGNNPNGDNEAIKEKIDALLQELNGKVVESTGLGNELNKIKSEDINKLDLVDENGEILENKNIQNLQESNNQLAYNQNNNQFGNGANKQGEFLKEDQQFINVSSVESNIKLVNTTLPKTQILRNINTTDVIAQIMDKIKFSIKPNISEIKMILKPEQLGEVSLKIATQNGIVTAQFIAENQKVKEVIEANFNQLRDMLSEQGIDVGSLEVNVSDENNNEQTFNMFEDRKDKEVEKYFEENIEDSKQKNVANQEELIDSNVSYSI